ncbi:MAG TPA: L-dopachrome tautomerase-related protein [Gammaproteobacteria bacterium]|nr:L-dopachrome tautomerase-related protein [Gammaproteobacteria bacterium]
MNAILKIIVFLVVASALVLGGLRLYFGGGIAYGDLTAAPAVPESGLETVLAYPKPIGNVAVSASGRLFFTVHPEARPDGPRLFEWRAGKAEAFPTADIQDVVLETPLGVAVDRQDRLWVVDPARHGFGRPRVVAIDLATGLVVHEHVFPRKIAPRGSFLQDLQVDPAGRFVYIADTSFWRKSPAVIVYDSTTRKSRRLLEGHESVRAQDWVIRTPMREMRFIGGLVPMKPGLDGIALDPTGQWLNFGAMAHDTLYRIATGALLDEHLTDAELAERVETLGRKPLSDGLSADLPGNVYITDVEHGAVLRMAPGGALSTVVKSPRIRWADALSFGPDGWLYLADSALPEVLLKSHSHINGSGPYHVYRFRPGTTGTPGQ